jgi:hypothetical protein
VELTCFEQSKLPHNTTSIELAQKAGSWDEWEWIRSFHFSITLLFFLCSFFFLSVSQIR